MIFADTSCVSFPGPGEHRVYTFNPMKEFIHNHQAHVDMAFESFKKTYDKNYAHDLEHKQRKEHFRHNLRYTIF